MFGKCCAAAAHLALAGARTAGTRRAGRRPRPAPGAGSGPARLSARALSNLPVASPSSQRAGVACHPTVACKIIIRIPVYAQLSCSDSNNYGVFICV